MKLRNRNSAPAPFAAPRIALFTHDTFGLGHVRRCLHIVRALAERAPESALLIISGSPALQVFTSLPPNVDFIRIPTIVRSGQAGHLPPHLPIPQAEVALIREQLIRQAVLSFSPDVFLVDNFPLGSGTELLATLKELSVRNTRTILGLRDVLDSPEVVRRDWERLGIPDVLERWYSGIVVYGMREVLDVARAYSLSPSVARKVTYCGYITDRSRPLQDPAAVRSDLGFKEPYLLATAGGGGDGFPLLKLFIESLRFLPPVPALVVTGPLMSAAQRRELSALAGDRKNVRVTDYIQDLPSAMAAARVVVSMCGYNTAAEIVSLKQRAIVVPRTWKYGEPVLKQRAGMEWEQTLRAEALARRGLVDYLEPESLSPEILGESIARSMNRTRTPRMSAVNLGGLDAVTGYILGLLGRNSAPLARERRVRAHAA